MRTKIIRILRFGPQWKVSLECGHTFTCTSADIKEGQLFIGKPVYCDLCGGAK